MSAAVPIPRLTVITLGVSDMRASIAFYEALGLRAKFRATGEAVAFFDTGGTVLGLFPWDQLARMRRWPKIRGRRDFEAQRWPGIVERPRRSMRSWISLISKGATLLKPRTRPIMAVIRGYFADPDSHPWEVVVRAGHRGSAKTGGFICPTEPRFSPE